MRRQLLPALGMLLVFTVLTGLAYPLAVTGFAQAAFGDRADGSLIERDGQMVGSAWIGQSFTEPEYFHPRPSATNYTPGPGAAAGSNEGPTSERFLLGEDDPTTPDVDESETTGVDSLVDAYREENDLADDAPVPVDAVTGSASSLDPHISVANARIQAARVADARDLDLGEVMRLVDARTSGRALGFLGEPGVNVLELNMSDRCPPLTFGARLQPPEPEPIRRSRSPSDRRSGRPERRGPPRLNRRSRCRALVGTEEHAAPSLRRGRRSLSRTVC